MVVVVVDVGTVDVVTPDPPPPVPPLPAPDTPPTTVVVVVVVVASNARPLAVPLEVLYPERDAATVTVDVPDAAKPETVTLPADWAAIAPLVAVKEYE